MLFDLSPQASRRHDPGLDHRLAECAATNKRVLQRVKRDVDRHETHTHNLKKKVPQGLLVGKHHTRVLPPGSPLREGRGQTTNWRPIRWRPRDSQVVVVVGHKEEEGKEKEELSW